MGDIYNFWGVSMANQRNDKVNALIKCKFLMLCNGK